MKSKKSKKPVTKKPVKKAARKVKETDTTAVQGPKAYLAIDANSHTALVIERGAETTTYIPMNAAGLVLETLPTHRRLDEDGKLVRRGFDDSFKPIPNYPLTRGLKIYFDAALQCGASPEALSALEGLASELTPEEQEEMKTKKTTAEAKAANTKSVAKTKAPREQRVTVASRFQELIMKGGKTDQAIFDIVKDEFGLDDKKRSYVGWYRNYLRKKGQNPPAPVKAKGEAKAKTNDKANGHAAGPKPGKNPFAAATAGARKTLAKVTKGKAAAAARK